MEFRVSHAQNEYDRNIHRDEGGDGVEGIRVFLKVVQKVHAEEAAEQGSRRYGEGGHHHEKLKLQDPIPPKTYLQLQMLCKNELMTEIIVKE